MAPNVVCLHKFAPSVCRNTHADVFAPIFGDHSKKGLHGFVGRKLTKAAQKLLGQVWGNSGKHFSHLQKFACSYTYVIISHLVHILLITSR